VEKCSCKGAGFVLLKLNALGPGCLHGAFTRETGDTFAVGCVLYPARLTGNHDSQQIYKVRGSTNLLELRLVSFGSIPRDSVPGPRELDYVLIAHTGQHT